MEGQLPCKKCNTHPPRELYRCLLCGRIPDEHPFPYIGCNCIRAAYLCDGPCPGNPR